MRNILPAALFLVLLASACAHPRAPQMTPVQAGSCRSASFQWYAPDDRRTRARLDSWCAGVGSVAFSNGTAVPAEHVRLQDITFVSWNIHVGNGLLREFVADLRAGRLTRGQPPKPFVLLLQEAVRGSGVPPFTPSAKGAKRIGAPHQDAEDIETLGREFGLWMVYAPSMRNGNGAADPLTDRGNAILSTLPLSMPAAIELPFERQRRVTLLASIALPGADAFSVGVIHLDGLRAPHRLWIFGTRGWRATQARAVESLLPGGNLVLGGDLNTWLGAGESAPRYFRQLFADTRTIAEESQTHRRVLDYMFFRAVPSGSTAHYLVVSNKYGSDHHPLLGWIN